MRRCCFFIGTSWKNEGVPAHFLALSRALVERGHRVVILVDGRRTDAEDSRGNPAIYTWPSARPTNPRDALFLGRLIQRYRPDCVIGNFGSTNVMMLVGWLMRVRIRAAWCHTLSTQTAMDRDSPEWKRAFLRARKTLVYAVSTHVVAVSEAAAADVRRFAFGLLRREKATVFHNGLSDPLVTGVKPGAGDRRVPAPFVCAGRFDRSKGQDVLINAVALLRAPLSGVCVEFLGNGPTLESCEKLARGLGVAERCLFVGSVSHPEVLGRMSGALATVVPSRSEAFGLVNIESMAVGTPVVASDVGGIPEIIRDGVDGFLVPPEDPQALAEKLSLLLANPQLADGMRAAARSRFLEHFEQRRAVSRLAGWLEEVVQLTQKT